MYSFGGHGAIPTSVIYNKFWKYAEHFGTPKLSKNLYIFVVCTPKYTVETSLLSKLYKVIDFLGTQKLLLTLLFLMKQPMYIYEFLDCLSKLNVTLCLTFASLA